MKEVGDERSQMTSDDKNYVTIRMSAKRSRAKCCGNQFNEDTLPVVNQAASLRGQQRRMMLR